MTLDLHHLPHEALAALLEARGERMGALIVDAPYSERTHTGHDDGTSAANRAAEWAAKQMARGDARTRTGENFLSRARRAARAGAERRVLHYASWSVADVERFVSLWATLTDGWIVSITDHVLAPIWASALEGAGRYVFSPIACVEPGSRVRMTGDGPAQWSCWAVVARPRDGEWLARWRERRREAGDPAALPGAYVSPSGQQTHASVGGKPLPLMRALVRDYSLRGDLVCDPCCGAGTTLVAAEMEGRRWVGGDISEDQLALARTALRVVQRPLF